MESSKAGKRVGILFYLLTFYILLQFFWWAYLLINLNAEIYAAQPILKSKIFMVLGEGAVFLIFLLLGIWFIQKTIGKEIKLVRQQRNFLLSITHELKTPLSAIKLCLETLGAHRDLPATKRESLEENALANTERLHNLIDNVLLATQIENDGDTILKESIDISTLTEEVIRKIEKGAAESAEIRIDITSNVKAKVDKSAFESIITNLVDNALKYGDKKPIEVSLFNDTHEIVLSVSDQGLGIPEDKKEDVFKKFYRLGNEETRSKKGTGLGLYIVKSLIDQHGGTISLKPNHPSGVIMEVRLPSGI